VQADPGQGLEKVVEFSERKVIQPEQILRCVLLNDKNRVPDGQHERINRLWRFSRAASQEHNSLGDCYV